MIARELLFEVEAVERAGGQTGGRGKMGLRGKRGRKQHKSPNPGADQGVGPAGSCRKIGFFVTLMANFRRRENTRPASDAKKIPIFFFASGSALSLKGISQLALACFDR
jgi:hypothetical protein